MQMKIIDARTILANYCVALNYHIKAKEAVAQIADLAKELNYKKRLPGIYLAIGSYHLFVEENFSLTWPDQTTYYPYKCGFPGTIRTNNRSRTTVIQFKINIIEDALVGKTLRQCFTFNLHLFHY